MLSCLKSTQKRKIQFIFMVFLFFALSSVAYSAPSVVSYAGNLIDGEVFQVYGTGFGNSGPNVFFFDNFESGIVGTKIKTGAGSSTIGQWEAISSNSPIYSNSSSLSGSKAFQAKCNTTTTGWASIQTLPANTKDVFLSYWAYIPPGDNYPGERRLDGTSAVNWKISWIMQDSVADNDLYTPGMLKTPTGSPYFVWSGNNRTFSPGTSHDVYLPKGTWVRIWAWMKGGWSNDGADVMWQTNPSGVFKLFDSQNVTTLSNGAYRKKLNLNGFTRDDVNSHPTFDDFYVATGPYAQARIEIGNNPNYNSCTKLTIATPVTWSDKTISATFREGSFNSGDNAYLFVIDANGVVSPGKQIQIGTSGAVVNPPPVLPSPPRNLRIASN